jgi:mannosyltransferase OCH1-like enzyme
MDTDVEVVRPLDFILNHEAVSGFESESQIPTGLMACREGHPLFKELLDEYEGIHFRMPDGSFDMTTNVTRITRNLLPKGLKQNNTLQTVDGFTLYPYDYFCVKSYADGKIYRTENSVTIHHFSGSWVSPWEKRKHRWGVKYPRFMAVMVAIKHALKGIKH